MKWRDLRVRLIESAEIKFPHSKTNTPRYNLPQIKSSDVQNYLNFLKLRSVEHTYKNVPVRNLKPTQNEFDDQKVRHFMKHDDGTPILVSQDGHILDGHHRWLGKYNKNENGSIRCIEIGLNIHDLLDTTKLYDRASYKTVDEDFNVI